jgi:lysophospholipase L1-like esterase
MKHIRLIPVLLAAFPWVSNAQQAASASTPPPVPLPDFTKPIVDVIDPKDGDTVVFLGDSITHQCLYTQYVEDYFYTRLPKTRIRFHNAGVSGDRAKDALNRFDEDVAAYKPKYVTILLGMNDGTYTDFQKPVFDTYQKDMSTVLDRIADLGATAVPMTPTMFDARSRRLFGKPAEPRDTYYNGVLALYGAWLREQAEIRGLGFVDMYAPLNAITLEQRAKDPKWSMIRDAIHPGPTGQVVMTAAILNDMVAPSPVFSIQVHQRQAKVGTTVVNGTIGEFTALDDKISFTFTANSLPWVLPSDAREGFQLTDAVRRFSSEKLFVNALKPGKYELKIDGQTVGTYTEDELEAGIELGANDKTPQYQQALKVAMLNKERNEKACHPIRDQYGALKVKRRDLFKATETNDSALDTKNAEFEAFTVTMKKTVADLLARARALEDQIYTENQPKPHRFEINATE